MEELNFGAGLRGKSTSSPSTFSGVPKSSKNWRPRTSSSKKFSKIDVLANWLLGNWRPVLWTPASEPLHFLFESRGWSIGLEFKRFLDADISDRRDEFNRDSIYSHHNIMSHNLCALRIFLSDCWFEVSKLMQPRWRSSTKKSTNKMYLKEWLLWLISTRCRSSFSFDI